MSFSRVTYSSNNALHVNGVPMSAELREIFTSDAVNLNGFLRDSVLYEGLILEFVLPMNRYHWLNENLAERISLYRLLVTYLVDFSKNRSALTNEFMMNINFLRPRECLEKYLDFQRELMLFFPSVSRGKIIYDILDFDSKYYREMFPNTSFGQLSQLLRGTSWVSPEKWGKL